MFSEMDDLGDRHTHNVVGGDVHGQTLMAGTINGDVHMNQRPQQVVELPHRAGASPVRAGFFQPRQVELPVEPETRTIVLTGLGGVGKTQLALDHAERAWEAGQVDLLVWVTADSRDAVVSAYASLARDLTGIEDVDLERGAVRLWEWLARTSARWLVVLDDVMRPTDLNRLWPPKSPNGRTVVTTRRTDAAIRGDGRKLINIGVFHPAESLSYLESALEDHTHLLSEAAELGPDLGHLPLALAQASAYMVDLNLPCDRYRARFADRQRTLATLFPDREHLPDGHQRTVAATWSLSVELADQLVPAGLARPLLMVASLLDPNGIPLDVFSTPSVLEWLTRSAGRRVSAEESRDGLWCLHRLSLISSARNPDDQAVRVHRLVQRVTRDTITTEQLEELTHAGAKALVEVWPEEFKDAVLGQSLRANTDALAASTGELLWRCSCREVLFRAAISLGHNGGVVAARTAFLSLTASAERLLGQDAPATLQARKYLARWTGEAGYPTQAVEQMETLLSDVVRAKGGTSRAVLEARSDLAHWRGQADDPHGALFDFVAMVPDFIAELGEDDLLTLTARGNAARFYGEAGYPCAAVSAYRELLPDLRRVLGEDHAATLTAAHNYAHWRGMAGDPVGAVAALRAVLENRARVLGDNHPHTLSTRGVIARWFWRTGNPDEAAKQLEGVVLDRTREFGAEHPTVVIDLVDLAVIWAHAGNRAKAQAALDAALAADESSQSLDLDLTRFVQREISQSQPFPRTHTTATSPAHNRP
ncbi:tetratricopeptide repeat protein [Lentzea sp. NPDC042327]|uniref:tetratricopeptide repeat protein n=1 Tax=Lentzea sp. NPDC042327 TaxID=3154801 RepID=UPI0033DE8216